MTGAGSGVPSPTDRVIVRSPGVIDVHAHAVLPMSLGCAGAAGGRRSVTAGTGVRFSVSGEYVLNRVLVGLGEFMDPRGAGGRDGCGGRWRLQMISPNPITYFRTSGCPLGDDYARTTMRLRGPPDVIPDGLSARPSCRCRMFRRRSPRLERPVRELGLVWLPIDTDIGDRTLDAPELGDFYSAAVELDVQVFIIRHLSVQEGPPDDTQFAVPIWTCCWALYVRRETLAVAALVFGGVLERHPALDVYLSHGGGTLAFVAGRFAPRCRQAACLGAGVPGGERN